jgi:hypothetical protein
MRGRLDWAIAWRRRGNHIERLTSFPTDDVYLSKSRQGRSFRSSKSPALHFRRAQRSCKVSIVTFCSPCSIRFTED